LRSKRKAKFPRAAFNDPAERMLGSRCTTTDPVITGT
jgi:hypothetical protein